MEMAIAELSTAQKTAETRTAVGVALLKQAQNAGEAQALALLEAIPQTPVMSVGKVDISA